MAEHVHAANEIVLIFGLVAWRLAMDSDPLLSVPFSQSHSPRRPFLPIVVTIYVKNPRREHGVWVLSIIHECCSDGPSGKIEPSPKGPTKDGICLTDFCYQDLEQKDHHHRDPIPRRS